MSRSASALVLVAVFVSSLTGVGCRSTREVRRPTLGLPQSDLANTVIDYVDTDGFDVVFEAALVNRDAVITVRTINEKPEWTGRLNAWIAAWNMGKTPDSRRFRGQFPVPSIDGDTLREFRLLVNDVVDRADDASKNGVSWWREERVRSRRVELLRPYNLRFHVHTDGLIHVIFFNGDYARDYRQFVAKIADCKEDESWSRTIEYSKCKHLRELAVRDSSSRDGRAAEISPPLLSATSQDVPRAD